MPCRHGPEYDLTIHAAQQLRDRRIDRYEINETIAKGEIRQSHKKNCKLFIKHFHYRDIPIAVVADVADLEILTVEKRYNHGND